VWRYYLYRVTNSAGFYVPVVILYLDDAGFGLDFVGLAYAVFAFGTLAAEIPTGYLGDWLGRRASLAVGTVVRVGVLVAYPLVETGAAILALHVAWAFGRSFRSGTEDAWLYELLVAHHDPDEFARVQGRASTLLLGTSAVAAVLGALLYAHQPALPFLANAGLAALGLPLLATFPAVGADDRDQPTASREADGDDDATPATDRFGVSDAVHVLRLQVERPGVRWLVAYTAIFHAAFLVARTYEQPALDAVGVPIAGFGVAYAAVKVVSAIAAASAGWWQDVVGVRRTLSLLVPVYGLAYVAVLVDPILVIPVIFLNRSVRVVVRPLRNQYLNDRLDDVGRATVLSGVAMAFALFGGFARLVAAPIADAVGAVAVLGYVGVAGAILAAVLWLAVDPVRSATDDADPGCGPEAPASSN